MDQAEDAPDASHMDDSLPDHPPHALGNRGEAIAMQFLRSRGWRILEHGYRLGRREIDVIGRRASTLAFVVVKTRSGRGWGAPEEAVTVRKRREIEAVALAYLSNIAHHDLDVGFDVVAIEINAGHAVRCEHIEDAWRPRPLT